MKRMGPAMIAVAAALVFLTGWGNSPTSDGAAEETGRGAQVAAQAVDSSADSVTGGQDPSVATAGYGYYRYAGQGVDPAEFVPGTRGAGHHGGHGHHSRNDYYTEGCPYCGAEDCPNLHHAHFQHHDARCSQVCPRQWGTTA